MLKTTHYKFFRSQNQFRAWLTNHHANTDEILVGFYKIGSGKGGITYQQALDEALCFGWIDGVRRSLDHERWGIRFTARKPRSIWSLVNVGHVKRLVKQGKMAPAGLAAFRKRDHERSKIYSHEVRNRPLAAKYVKKFKANKKAWEFYLAQPPSYQRVTRWWIIWAKQETTRERRLDFLIRACARQIKVDGFVSRKKQGLA